MSKTASDWNIKGNALGKLGKYKDAIDCYDKALEIDPEYAYAWNNKGLALYNIGKHKEAIECYDKVLEIDPKNAYAWNNKGIALRKLGRHEEAIKCYDKALDIDPKYTLAWNNKGFALGKLGRHEEAIKCYDKALDIVPNYEKAKDNKKLAEKKLREQKEQQKRRREESKPEIEVELPEKTFKPNYWKTINLIVRNKGNAHARGVNVSFSKEAEVKGLKELNIDSGEEEKLSIALKPVELGEVPLTVKTVYKDVYGKEYGAENLFMLSVSEEVGKEEKEEKKERVKAPAFFPEELEDYYSEVQYVGEGGFARVFKARRRNEKGEIVALKIPKALDTKSGKVFTDEIGVWKTLKHENIVRLFDYNISPTPYLEMEFVEGSLDEIEEPIPPENAVELVFKLAEGLHYAHQRQILHRDLKPGNILLEKFVPKISDWGLSKVMGASQSSSKYGYTPLYAAPELIYPDEFGRTDERTDIFQLGTIFYELLTGKNPFDAETRTEIESAFRVRQPKRPSEINPVISDRCDQIVMKCLEKRKEHRYQNMHELRADLAGYLKEEYKKSLKISSNSGDKRKSVLYCANLASINARVGDFNETMKYAEDLKNYIEGERIKLAERMANSFRIIFDIRTKWCNRNAKVRDVNRKYRELKEILAEEDLIKEMEEDKDLGMVIREMNAELREDEHLDDKHVEKLEYFCVRFVEMWIARFLK